MSVWQAKPKPTGSSLAVCNLAKGVDHFSFQRIAAFQDETGPPSARMKHRLHLQCQLQWIAGDFLEGHVKRILGLCPGSVGKSKGGWWARAARGRHNESMWAGQKKKEKENWADPKSPAISFYRWEIKAQNSLDTWSQNQDLNPHLSIPIYCHSVTTSCGWERLLLKMGMRWSPPAFFQCLLAAHCSWC